MKLLLVSNANSVHVYNYINHVLLPMACDITIYSIHPNSVYEQFYKEHNITVIESANIKGFWARVPKFRGIAQIVNMVREVSRLGNFDFCHVHSYTYTMMLAACTNKRHFGKIILSYWGSEILRVNKAGLLDKILVKKTDIITIPTKVMVDKFYTLYGNRYESRVKRVLIGCSTLEIINSVLLEETQAEIKLKLGLTDDKILVSCGHNASTHQHHKSIVEAISHCNDTIKNRIYLVIPMGYGEPSQSYIDDVKNSLEQSGLEGRVITELLYHKDNARLRIASDILIHVQTTDAFSIAMQEHMYAGTVVMNGDWLNYKELDELGAEYIKIKSIQSITEELSLAVNNLSMLKQKCLKNREIIWNLSSWAEVVPVWLSIYS
jgi:hypothetical protein